MSSNRAAGGGAGPPTANDRLKRSWNRWLGGSFAVVLLLHAALFAYSPAVEVPVFEAELHAPAKLLRVTAIRGAEAASRDGREVAIPVPALPTVDNALIDLTIAPTVPLPELDDVAILSQALIPELGSETGEDRYYDYRAYAPYVVRPTIRNRQELRKFLERQYQPILEISGATGVVAESSGSRSLDRLAIRLTRVLRFTPAMLAGRPIRIEVRLPITFRAT